MSMEFDSCECVHWYCCRWSPLGSRPVTKCVHVSHQKISMCVATVAAHLSLCSLCYIASRFQLYVAPHLDSDNILSLQHLRMSASVQERVELARVHASSYTHNVHVTAKSSVADSSTSNTWHVRSAVASADVLRYSCCVRPHVHNGGDDQIGDI